MCFYALRHVALGLPLIGRSMLFAGCLLFVGCESDARSLDALEVAHQFIAEDARRQEVLEASLSEFQTPYGELRLAAYSREWSALPTLSLPVREFVVQGGTALPNERTISEPAGLDPSDWYSAGLEMFLYYPAQISVVFERLRSRELAEAIGFEVDDSGVVLGLVEVRTESGWVPAVTCAACHSARRENELVMGLPNETLDYGSLTNSDWPLGTMDVTSDGFENPTRPTDLRPIVFQSRLHHTGNVRNGRMERMLRIETLLITGHRTRFRPPRALTAALSLYLESLADTLVELDSSHPGAPLFAANCSGCHQGRVELAGPPVAQSIVGTDPRATELGTERGTGAYRAPSLRGVAERRGILHDGSVADIQSLLRLDGEVARDTHPFGLGLSRDERQSIVAFLSGAR